MKKRFLSIVMSLLMVATLIPGAAVSVMADGEENQITLDEGLTPTPSVSEFDIQEETKAPETEVVEEQTEPARGVSEGAKLLGGNEDDHVARIGDSLYYNTLAAAFAAAEGHSVTIEVLANCSGGGIVVPEGSDITVNFNNFTYTVNSSTGTENQCFQLLKDSTIVFNNGSIVANNAEVTKIIQNYSKLTLNNMVLDATQGTNNVNYVLSTNNGSTTINDTTITAKTNGIAFDVCSGRDGYASNNVEVKGTSEIKGNIEVSFGGQENTAAPKLTLTAGTLTGSIVMGQGAEQATVTKAKTFNAAAPDGYKWVGIDDTAEKLVTEIKTGTDGKLYIGNKEWKQEENKLLLPNGSYELVTNIDISVPIVVVGNPVSLNIGNYNIHYGDNTTISGVIKVSEGAMLDLYGDTGTINGGKGFASDEGLQGGGVYVEKGGHFYMNSGKITLNNVSNTEGEAWGGGVFVENGAAFTMFGGSITANVAKGKDISKKGYGGGVFVQAGGTIEMFGGTITGNTADICKGVMLDWRGKANLQLVTDASHKASVVTIDKVYLYANTNIDEKIEIVDPKNEDGEPIQGGKLVEGSTIRVARFDNNEGNAVKGAFTAGLKGKLPEGKKVTDIFTSDFDYDYVAETTGGEAELVLCEAYIGTVGYATLDEAITNASNWSTITLLKDVKLVTATQVIDKDLTIDLNGKTITSSASPAFNVTSALTVKDSTATTAPVANPETGAVTYTSGSITATGGNAINVTGGTLTVQSGTIASTTGQGISVRDDNNGGTATVAGGYVHGVWGVCGFNNATINISGGVVVGDTDIAVSGNGLAGKAYKKVNITGGTIIGKSGTNTQGGVSCAVYQPNSSALEIKGTSTIVSLAGPAVVVRAGSVTIGDTATITGKGTATGKVGDCGNAVPASAIVLDVKAGYPGAAHESDKITIAGGTLKSDEAVGTISILEGTTTETQYVDGSIVATAPIANALEDGYEWKQNSSGTYDVVKAVASITYTIVGAEISGLKDVTYNGEPQTQDIKVTLGNTVLIEGTDYTVSYKDNTDAGIAMLTVTGIKAYKDSVDVSFNINPASIKGATVKLKRTTYTYTGKEKKPAITSVTLKDGTVLAATDYKFAYENNINAGTAKVYVKGIGNYTGTASAKFTIKQDSQKFKSIKPTAKSYKASALAKAAKSFQMKAVLSRGDGKVTYKLAKDKKGIVSKVTKSGKVTIKKGTKAGKYVIYVKATAAKTTNFKQTSKTVKITITVTKK